VRVLIADDDRVTATMLSAVLKQWQFEVQVAADGGAALTLLQTERPAIAILDWMMPTMNGPDLCRHIRGDVALAGTYVILLTSRTSSADVISGLDAGADDYITKPFNRDELRARLQVGVRVTTLQTNLADRVNELQQALAKITQLEGLLPICSYCKRIRSEGDDWNPVEQYIAAHSQAEFTHGICPSCFEQVAGEKLPGT
jgi:phosphoserine phosphatase RsbU/P